MPDNQPEWVVCDGGPHLLLPTELVHCWEGVSEPSNGRIVQARFRYLGKESSATDYDLACDVEEEIGLIPVGAGYGLVIGQAVPMSIWIPLPESRGGVIAVPMFWDCNVTAVLPSSNFKDAEFVPTKLVISTESGTFTLLAASDCGPKWVYPHSVITVTAGTYAISKANYSVPDFEARLYRLLPILGT